MKSEKSKKTELFIWGILFAACVIIAFAQKIHDTTEQKQVDTIVEVTTQELIDSGKSTHVDSESEQTTSEELKEDDIEEVPSGVIK